MLILAIALAVPPARSQHGTIDANETLFTVMAAFNLSGFDTDLDSPSNHPLRGKIRQLLGAKDLPSVEKLKRFYAGHYKNDPAADLSQLISFSLLSGGPPGFEFPELEYQLPPDVQALDGLGPLLAEFHTEAGIASLYEQVQPAVEEIAAQYHEPVTRGLFEINGYLRNPTSGVPGRSFQVVLSLLAPPNQIQTRSYRSDYYIVLTPSAEPQIEDVLYTYLHYVLEPTIGRAVENLERIRPLGDYALGAPHLPEHYKRDFQLLAASSLIKALQARLTAPSPGDRAVMVDEAYRQGYILTPAFAGQLPAYEKQDTSMRFYFREMVDAVDLAKEEARVQGLEFDQEAPVRKAEQAPAPVVEPSEAERLIEEAEGLYEKRDLEQAREVFLRLLRESAERPVKAKAYYGLARIATLRNDPELATSLFERTLTFSPEPKDRAWTLVYLGRLHDLSGEPEEAAGYYRDALAIGEASGAARSMAEKGASGAFQRRREP